jgi:hypothetical protein
MPDQTIKPESIEEKFPEGGETNQSEKAEVSNLQIEKIPQPESGIERKEGRMEKEDSYSKILAQAVNPVLSTEKDISQDAELTMREKDAESKVNNLVSLAETKGLAHAVRVAKHMEDNYILDEFHDKLLSSELHDFLVKKGLIREM